MNNAYEVLMKGINDDRLGTIAKKVFDDQRISSEDAVYLYKNAELGFVGSLANYIRESRFGDTCFFNKNFHIEPTNVCVFDCKFCAYSRMLKNADNGWLMSADEMIEIVNKYKNKDVTEVHLVGGVHPKMGLEYFGDLIAAIKKIMPDIHVKGFTAVELEYMIRKAKMSYKDGLKYLKSRGLDSIPGGGAEIFDEEVRKQICADKASSEQWLAIHRSAHELGIPSNATILYGHIESYEHRVHHMQVLRDMQDETGGYNTFIPLKFRNGDNQMSHVNEVTVSEDLRNYAISRIFMDNFNHIKAYWPMIGRSTAALSLAFGVDDIDGTIDDTTKIYSMAGAEEQNPTMTTSEIVELIKGAGRNPVERDTLYNTIRDYKEYQLEESSIS